MRLSIVMAITAGALAGCEKNSKTPLSTFNPPGIPEVTGQPKTMDGVEYIDLAKGSGSKAAAGQCYYVHYTGWLATGQQFVSTIEPPREPVSFRQGESAITGLDRGFKGMRVGGKRRLLVPPELGFGMEGSQPTVPPNSVLIFDVELMAADDPDKTTEIISVCKPWSVVQAAQQKKNRK